MREGPSAPCALTNAIPMVQLLRCTTVPCSTHVKSDVASVPHTRPLIPHVLMPQDLDMKMQDDVYTPLQRWHKQYKHIKVPLRSTPAG